MAGERWTGTTAAERSATMRDVAAAKTRAAAARRGESVEAYQTAKTERLVTEVTRRAEAGQITPAQLAMLAAALGTDE